MVKQTPGILTVQGNRAYNQLHYKEGNIMNIYYLVNVCLFKLISKDISILRFNK